MIYLDNNATTPMAREAIGAMTLFLDHDFGNPSSAHAAGRVARTAVDDAREKVARLVGAARPDEIVFTASGSEADNWAILAAHRVHAERTEIVTTTVEHEAVSKLCDKLAGQGTVVHRIGVDGDGSLDTDALRRALNKRTAVVSAMLANNETGILFPVADIAEIVKEHSDALMHVDGVNAVGKVAIDLHSTRIDLFSMSGHKFHGPKGIGALYVRNGVNISPAVIGGGQERGLRAGTEAVHQIVGMGAAADVVRDTTAMADVGRLRDRLETEILNRIPDTYLNGTADRARRLPNTSSVSFAGVNGEMIMHMLDQAGVCVSTGSACHAEDHTASSVLQAMDIPYSRAMGAIRFSLSRYNTDAEIDQVLAKLPEIIAELRRMAA